MALQKTHKNLSVYILCCGLPYGNGEDLFYDFFRRSWLSLHPLLARLPVLEMGENIVPTIHVQDIAQSVKFLVRAKPKQQYVIAVDQGKHKLKDIIKTIS